MSDTDDRIPDDDVPEDHEELAASGEPAPVEAVASPAVAPVASPDASPTQAPAPGPPGTARSSSG